MMKMLAVGLIVVGLIALYIVFVLIKTVKNREYMYANEYFKKVTLYVPLLTILIASWVALFIPIYKNSRGNKNQVTAELQTIEGTAQEVETESGIIDETYGITEITEEEKVETELLREIELLKRNDEAEFKRWFGESKELKGIASSIPDIKVESSLDGELTLLVYNDELKKTIEDDIRERVTRQNVGMTEQDINSYVDQEMRGHDNKDFYTTYNVKVSRVNGLIEVTEELKNIITNGSYLGRVINGVSEKTNETIEDNRITEEILNRGNGS